MRNIARVIAISLCIGITSGQQEVLGDKLDAAQRYENVWHGIANWNGVYDRTDTVEMTQNVWLQTSYLLDN